MRTVKERFLDYIQYHTTSDPESKKNPSTDGQLILARYLAEEMKVMGVENVFLDEKGILYGKISSNTDIKIPSIGFIAHLDTSPDISGENVKASVIENYDGNDIILNESENIVLRTDDFPEVKKYTGKSVIVTDGRTLLGADDKAGIAEIMTVAEYLCKNREIIHGDIMIAFTPDEEIGKGTENFDTQLFGVDYAYTIDGGEAGEIQYECFNAAKAKIKIKGKNLHPGSAKNKMINSASIACEMDCMLPCEERPENTDNREGFYHLNSIQGDVEKSELNYIIRDFDSYNFSLRKKKIREICRYMEKKYNADIQCEIEDQYYNMKEKVLKYPEVIENAVRAMQDCGVKPLEVPIRGGTDGAKLSWEGLPCPNIFAGGHNFHSKFEYISVESMEKAVEVILGIIDIYASEASGG